MATLATTAKMDLASLSNEELEAALRKLLNAATAESAAVNQLEEAIRDLQVHRYELEMQNRALRRSEGDLEHSLQRYADLYDFAPVGLVSVTARGRIHEANLTAAELFWLDRQKVVGSYFRHFLDQDDSVQFAIFLERCLSTSSRLMLEVYLRPKGGASPFCVQLSGQAVTEPNTDERLVRIAISDITELKKAERLLAERGGEQSDLFQLTAANLRSLVQKIEMACAAGGEHEPVKKTLPPLKGEAEKLQELLEKLALYSRLSFVEVKPQTVSIDAIVQEVVTRFEPMVQQRHGRIVVHHPLPKAYASPELLGDAIARVVDNAVKFTREGRPPVVRISSLQVGGRAVIMVADEGPGLTRDEQQKLFSLSDHVLMSGARHGTGLGLPIVQKAMQRMNGRCWMESKPHEGCCFYFELPEAPAD